MNPNTGRIPSLFTAALAIVACCANLTVRADNPQVVPTPSATPASSAPPKVVMKKAGDLLKKQDPPKVVPRLMDMATPDNVHVLVSLAKQRAYLFVGDEIAIDTPVSTGKRAGMTPAGKFTVLEKDPDHRSNVYGSFVDGKGRTVRSGVSVRIDSAPSGTHYVGAPMKWFMRLTDEGVGMHIGILPGYPASHGCVRLPEEIAPLIYQKVKIGTPVEISSE